MIKTYKANTNVSINVVLESKKNLHISFVPLSDGSSRYTTDNEDIQQGIESHYKFGKLFRLIGAENVTMKKKIIRVRENVKEKKASPLVTMIKDEAKHNEGKIIETQENTNPTEAESAIVTENSTDDENKQENTQGATEQETIITSENLTEEEATYEEIDETEEETEEVIEEAEEEIEFEDEEPEQEKRVVKVSDLAAAKDFLADTYGISRTILRGKKSIENSAAAYGIVFEGLD